MTTITHVGYVFVLMAFLWSNNCICDNNLNDNNEVDNELSTEANVQDVQDVQDNSILSKILREDLCRKKLSKFVRELCRPYIRSERRQLCEMMFPYRPMTREDRRLCQKNLSQYNVKARRQSVSRAVRSCCQESCSVSTLTKYCRPSAPPQITFGDDRDAIFSLKLPSFKPPQNFGQFP